MTHADPVKGRRLVLVIVGIALTISIAAILLVNLLRGPSRAPQQIVRFLLTVALSFFLAKGRPWARWISAVLFVLGGGTGVLAGLGILDQTAGGWVLIAMGLAYLYCGAMLLFSRHVSAFFSRRPQSV